MSLNFHCHGPPSARFRSPPRSSPPARTDCLVLSLKQEYLPRCNPDDLHCLCSSYGSNGYTAPELARICSQSCSGRPPALDICNGISNAVAPVKRSETTSPSHPAPRSSKSTPPISSSASSPPSMASLLAPAATTPASNQSASGGLSTSQLVTVSIAGFAFVVGAVFAAIMIYRRKRRKHADVEAPKERSGTAARRRTLRPASP